MGKKTDSELFLWNHLTISFQEKKKGERKKIWNWGLNQEEKQYLLSMRLHPTYEKVIWIKKEKYG